MRSLSDLSAVQAVAARSPQSTQAIAWLSYLVFCATCGFGYGQTGDKTCRNGEGNFEHRFFTGVSVRVGATTNGEFSARGCAAELLWNNHELKVAQDAWSVDIDMLGTDMGIGSPVVAFQIRKRDIDPRSKYRIYSLKDPSLLRTITGGDSYSAADTNLDGRIEIWTDDASGVDGFEGIPLSSYDFAPTVVLRFEQQKLLDVSSQFASYYDSRIAELRSRLAAQDLREFMESDGLPAAENGIPYDRQRRLERTKIQVLEIVWCYLYSGREGEAWQALEQMWPAGDVERIRAAIVNAQQHGIRAEIDGVAAALSPRHSQRHVEIYNASSKKEWAALVPEWGEAQLSNDDSGARLTPDSKPEAIDLFRPEPMASDAATADTPEQLDLVIDEAGKVRRAKLVGKVEDNSLLAAAAAWKFIPAFKDNRAVACRMLYNVQGQQ